MARTKISIDKAKFEQAVRQAEANGPLPNISALTVAVAEIYNAMDGAAAIQPQVVGLRLKEFGLEIKTKKGKRGRSPGGTNRPREEREPRQEQCPQEPKKRRPRQEPKDDDERPVFSRRLVVWTPAGKCPVKLSGTSKQEVREWAEAVIEAGFRQNKNYTHNAIKYFVRHFYEMFSENWNVVVGHLDMWLRESQGVEA